ncbi:type VII secretion target [Mycobacterium sp. SMC-4]|uniref:type VII secretion target n=1 Tax=Mycobacterium sp. SMC-4 TaxID=2857059 RepID=UPI003CFEECF2
MWNETLRVEPGHVRELAAKHAQAAAELASAAALVDGVDTDVQISHGVIAWPSAGALATVQRARQRAARRIAERSAELSDGLASAAARYLSTDDSSGAALDRTMTPTPPAPRLR